MENGKFSVIFCKIKFGRFGFLAVSVKKDKSPGLFYFLLFSTPPVLISYICSVRAADMFELHNLKTIPSEALSKNRPHPVPIAIGIGASHKKQDNSGSLRNPSSSNLVNKRGFVTL
ncbi:hypothetical protein DDT91_00605 [Algoriphagus sp. AK58]|nr:hypothetical protein [Algoriphagus sp. AK58]